MVGVTASLPPGLVLHPPPVPLQSSASAVAVAGTFASFALFLSVTAHIAARNVLGDVPVRRAFVVGPVPAAVAVVFTTFGWNSFLGILLAVTVDATLIKYVYGRSRRLTAYITFIHAVVSVILGSILVAGFLLLQSAPG